MTTQIKPVRGKVARVLSEREVAINRGLNDGVVIGMEFNILNPDTQEIRDPDTGESLGRVESVNLPVRVTGVNDRLAIARTFRVHRVNVGGNGIGIGVFIPPIWRKRYETIRENGAKSKLKGGAKFSKQVSVGDGVVQVIEAEADDNTRKPARLTPNA